MSLINKPLVFVETPGVECTQIEVTRDEDVEGAEHIYLAAATNDSVVDFSRLQTRVYLVIIDTTGMAMTVINSLRPIKNTDKRSRNHVL